MTDQTLSPAAQAVKDAVIALYSDQQQIRDWGWRLDAPTVAAALRAAAQTLAYEIHCPGEGWYELVIDANDLYDIATELEGA